MIARAALILSIAFGVRAAEARDKVIVEDQIRSAVRQDQQPQPLPEASSARAGAPSISRSPARRIGTGRSC